jgi:hypothetical protein
MTENRNLKEVYLARGNLLDHRGLCKDPRAGAVWDVCSTAKVPGRQELNGEAD